MIKILIVEDHESMRQSIRTIFERSGDFEIIGDIANAEFAENYCENLLPDLVLMDVCTEDGASGLLAAKKISEKYPEIKVIIMTAFNEVSYIPRAKEAGAHAFIFKSESLDYFMEVAKGVMKGEKYFPEPKVIPMPMGEAPFTEREMTVLRLSCKLMTNKEIAEELFISENTVKYHKANMLAKTGFTKTVELVFYMITNGWINPLY